uniref:Uncharacterized protein n=1 Tax=Nelumbo nucifera TaxID=4432 RepID=A0A822ZEL4_NELNU|nr:TPA_asm: hypothetical protein HUJ06_001802 [Nelumbo nucifera]
MPHAHSQTVVVENPMSVDESGKLVILLLPNYFWLSFFFKFPRPIQCQK